MRNQPQLERLERQVTYLEATREERKKEVLRLQQETTLLLKEAQLLEHVDQALLALSTAVLGKSTKSIDTLATAALQAIFEDQKLELKTTLDKARGKTAVTFDVYENGTKRDNPEDSYGGGVIAVIGVILRVTTILATKAKRIMILDESLAHVSSQYVPNVSRFIEKLCEELGFTVILVTHQPEFATYADRHYELKPAKGGLEADRKR